MQGRMLEEARGHNGGSARVRKTVDALYAGESYGVPFSTTHESCRALGEPVSETSMGGRAWARVRCGMPCWYSLSNLRASARVPVDRSRETVPVGGICKPFCNSPVEAVVQSK